MVSECDRVGSQPDTLPAWGLATAYKMKESGVVLILQDIQT